LVQWHMDGAPLCLRLILSWNRRTKSFCYFLTNLPSKGYPIHVMRIGKLNGIFAPVFPGAHPRNPTAWTPQRLYVPLPAPAGQRAGEVWGASPGYPWGESLGTAGRRGGRMAPGHAQAHRHARGLCGAHVADRTTLAWA